MSTMPRLIGLATPVLGWLLLAALLSFGTLAAGIALMATSAYLISKAAVVAGFSTVALVVACVRGIAITRAALRYAERYVSHLAAFRLLTQLRIWTYKAIEPIAPAGLLQHRSGDLLSRIAVDIDSLDRFFVRGVVPPLGAALAMILAAGIVGAFDFRLALVLVASFVVASMVPFASARVAETAASKLAAVQGQLSAVLADQVQGMHEVIVFGQANEAHDRVVALGTEVERMKQHLAFARGVNSAIVALLAGAAALAVLLLAIPMVDGTTIEGIYLALLPLTALAGFEAVQQISSSVEEMNSTRGAGTRLFELLDRDAQRKVTADQFPSSWDHSLEFRNVSFRYDEAEPFVLEVLSFRIRSGERMTLTGPSGAGKTTVVNLLLRLWDCEQGAILIGDRDISSYDPESVRRLIGVVPQTTYLFNGTLRDNLLLAKADATDKEIAGACQKAKLDEVVAALSKGLDTLVGEDGHKLSGGERQRVAIARAILKDAPIVILDEATSHLDDYTEQRVGRALEEFMSGRTCLIIAHAGEPYWSREHAASLPSSTIRLGR
jgi:ATP-binding cassette subfamily C protein CydC